MKVLNDFRCNKCASTEYFVDNDNSTTNCRVCGNVATKVISAINFQLEGRSGDFPTAADKWVKKREQKMAQERKLAN
jgi:predicted nucleic acid-binding Zn ribbon protein